MKQRFNNKKISKIKCDNGGEYSSNLFKNFCTNKGIEICYTPQMNGVAERMNQTLMDKARAMITQAGMNKVFWEEAILTAAYLTNRIQSCQVKDKTPFELWSNKKPNVSNMRVFGCIAYSKIPDSFKNKIEQ